MNNRANPEPDDPPFGIEYDSVLEPSDDQYRPDYYTVTDLRDNTEVKLCRGYEYWDTDQRHMVCIRDVFEKHHVDNQGGEMETHGLYVRLEPDHPKYMETMNDGTLLLPLQMFLEKLDSGEYVPHSANGYLPPELNR